MNLEKLLSHIPLSIVLNQKCLELRPCNVDKAIATKSILHDLGKVGFIICIGDGKTDEVVFELLKEFKGAISATVGKKRSDAEYYIEDVDAVQDLLDLLIEK